MPNPLWEIFPENDAASVYEEANSNSAWTITTDKGTGTSEAPGNGSAYYLKLVATGTYHYSQINVVTIGLTAYRLTFDYKAVSPNEQQLIHTNGTSDGGGTTMLLNTSWTTVSVDINTNASDYVRTWNFYATRGLNAGEELHIDNVKLEDISLIPPTTTVEVTWIDSISAAATGNKIYRDDVEIADIANGIQFYSDPDAPAGTESKYEVQAYSATDETTQEVLGVNVQYITTA